MLLKCVGICNVFNLSAILPCNSGYPHTEELTVLSFFLKCSFTRGNTEECHLKSYYAASVLGYPFPKRRQSAWSILAGCWSELTLGLSYSQWTDTDTYGRQPSPPTRDWISLHARLVHCCTGDRAAEKLWQLCRVATNKFRMQANKRKTTCGETVK